MTASTEGVHEATRSEIEFVQDRLLPVARKRLHAMPSSVGVEDLVQVALLAYCRGVKRLGLEDRPVADRYAILYRRMTGSMIDETRRMASGYRSTVGNNGHKAWAWRLTTPLTTNNYESDEGPPQERVDLPTAPAAEDLFLLREELTERFDALKILPSRHRGIYKRYLWGETLMEIADSTPSTKGEGTVSESRISQIVKEAREIMGDSGHDAPTD